MTKEASKDCDVPFYVQCGMYFSNLTNHVVSPLSLVGS